MDHDLKDIALIDRFLNNEMTEEESTLFKERYKSDKTFQNEVDKYRMIYDGLEEIEEKKLKKRLSSYYQEFDDTKSKGRGKIRRLIWISSGIAAVLCIGWLLSINQTNGPTLPKFPADGNDSVGIDTLKFKLDSLNNSNWVNRSKDSTVIDRKDEVIVEADPNENLNNKDSILELNKLPNESQLALVGYKKLPQHRVKKMTYPRPLRYQFDNGSLRLFGDPLKGTLAWKIYKRDTMYLLGYGSKLYGLQKSKSIQRLKEIKETNSTFNGLINKSLNGTATNEQIKFQLEELSVFSTQASGIEVSYGKEQLGNSTYYFKQVEETLHLILNIDFDPKETSLFVVEEKNKRYYYLKTKQNIYALNPSSSEESNLKPVNILTDEKARLFIQKDPVVKTVFHLN